MESGTLSEDSFVEFAKKYVPFLHVTTRIPTDPHQNLLSEKGGNGFPYLVYLDAEGEVLAKHQGSRSVEAFEATAKGVQAWVDAKKKVDAGDASAKDDLFIAELRLGKIEPEEARRRMAEFPDLTAEQKKEIETILLDAEVMAMAKGVGRDRNKLIEAGKTFAGWAKEGKVPSEENAERVFWYYILMYAEAETDVENYEKALDALRPGMQGDPRGKAFLEQAEAKLKSMRGQ